MYSFHLLSAAIEDLAKLDKSAARRILARIDWLAENFEFIKHETLKGELSGLYKFRAGNYRIIYEVFEEEKLVTIHSIGHRREVYKRR
jgi:mRNA interferase RelE/StbE